MNYVSIQFELASRRSVPSEILFISLLQTNWNPSELVHSSTSKELVIFDHLFRLQLQFKIKLKKLLQGIRFPGALKRLIFLWWSRAILFGDKNIWKKLSRQKNRSQFVRINSFDGSNKKAIIKKDESKRESYRNRIQYLLAFDGSWIIIGLC